MNRFQIVLFFFMLQSIQLFVAQRTVKDSAISTPWVGVHYGGNFPSGDLDDRYGYLNHIGVMAGYKTAKQFYLGLDANFIESFYF